MNATTVVTAAFLVLVAVVILGLLAAVGAGRVFGQFAEALS